MSRLTPLDPAVHAATLVADAIGSLGEMATAFRDAIELRVAEVCPSLDPESVAFEHAANVLAFLALCPDGPVADVVAAYGAKLGAVAADLADAIGAFTTARDLQVADESLYLVPPAPDAATTRRASHLLDPVVGTWSSDPSDVGTPRRHGLRVEGARVLTVTRRDPATGQRRQVTVGRTYGYTRLTVRDLHDYMTASGWSHAVPALLGTETRSYAEVGQTGYKGTDPVTGLAYWHGTTDLADTLGKSISAPARRRIEHLPPSVLLKADGRAVNVGGVTYLPSKVRTRVTGGYVTRSFVPVVRPDGAVEHRCTITLTGDDTATRTRRHRARVKKGTATTLKAPAAVRSLTSAATLAAMRDAATDCKVRQAWTDPTGRRVSIIGTDDGRRAIVNVRVGKRQTTRTVPVGRIAAVVRNATR